MRTVRKQRTSLERRMERETDGIPVTPSQPVGENPKDFTTRLLPTSGRRTVRMSPRRWPVADPSLWNLPGAAPRIATTPTTADLWALHGGKGRLLTAREAADKLRVGCWASYQPCKSGELQHVRIIDSIRIRPADLAAFAAQHRRARRPPSMPPSS